MIRNMTVDDNIIYYKFPLSHCYDYAKTLSYEDIVYAREAIGNNDLDDADGFSHCHARMLNTVAMEYLIASVK